MSCHHINNSPQLPAVPQTLPSSLEELSQILFEEENQQTNINPFETLIETGHSLSFGDRVAGLPEAERNAWSELFQYEFDNNFSQQYERLAVLHKNDLQKPTIKLTKPQISLNEMKINIKS